MLVTGGRPSSAACAALQCTSQGANTVDVVLSRPIPALDGRYPLRFARIVVKRPGVDNPFEGPTLEGPLGADTAIVELKSGWESWRVSHLRHTHGG